MALQMSSTSAVGARRHVTPRHCQHAGGIRGPRCAHRVPSRAPPCTRRLNSTAGAPAPSSRDIPERLRNSFRMSTVEVEACLEMARLHNVLPSFLLVFVGACCAARGLQPLLMGSVWVMAAISAGIAISSVMVNDYFDFRLGVDSVETSAKPLPRGLITPDSALLVAALIYIAILIVACMMPSVTLRLITAAATATTVVYTPLVKRITFMKNAAVAFVIAASPVSGAVATGLGPVATAQVLPAALFLFFAICHREVIMDIDDRKGDAATGVHTIPVTIGPHGALAFANAMLCLGVLGAAAGTVSSAHPLNTLLVPLLACVAAVAIVAVRITQDVVASDFQSSVVAAAVSRCLGVVGIGLVGFSVLGML